jgi:retron-type reverse transcriptase
MTLDKASIAWAIEFLSAHSDGDLFPRLPELEAVVERRDDFSSLIEGKDMSQFTIGAARRLLVPKDDFSYRQATQLDPQDSILLTAAVHQFGNGIEQRRLSRDVVFSYRFQPDPVVGLYSGESAWNKFWSQAHSLSKESGAILYCDIADFYNEIYHHTVENQLIEAGFPNQAKKWIIELLKSTTAGVSLGPHTNAINEITVRVPKIKLNGSVAGAARSPATGAGVERRGL